ncbi:MAG TPA: hypothetical protein P5118_20395 [Planctomycetota bacterium]|nr:hypothetical protein [Planctomycetota bacterium]
MVRITITRAQAELLLATVRAMQYPGDVAEDVVAVKRALLAALEAGDVVPTAEETRPAGGD